MTQFDAEKQEERMERAMQCAIDATSGNELLDIIDTLVDDDWLGGIEPLVGNVYRAIALGSIKHPSCRDLCGGIRSSLNVKFFGAILVWIIQILGPVILVLTCWPSDWKVSTAEWFRSWSLFGTRLLSLLMIIMFNLHALYEIGDEAASFEKVSSLFNHLGCDTKYNTSRKALAYGAITNCWVRTWSPIATFIVMASAENGKDVLFDALSIAFLYNLDNIGGELSFLHESAWPGQQLSWMYNRMSSVEDPPPSSAGCVHEMARWIILPLNVVLPFAFCVTDFGRGKE